MDDRYGVVFLDEDPERELPFHGHWEDRDPPTMLEDGPGWATPAEAVTWGRERAQVVLLRMWPGRYFSAGVSSRQASRSRSGRKTHAEQLQGQVAS